MFIIWYTKGFNYPWMMYIYPVPISFLLGLIFSCIWSRRLYRLICLSLLGWSSLFLLFMILMIFVNFTNAWLVFIVGIPMQIIMFLSFAIGLKFDSNERKEKQAK